MNIIAIPFNAAPRTSHALARQLCGFACDMARTHAGIAIDTVNVFLPLDQSPNPRMGLVNPAETFNDVGIINHIKQQSRADYVLDGLVEQDDEGFSVTIRLFDQESEEPVHQETFRATRGQVLPAIMRMVHTVIEKAGAPIPEAIRTNLGLFGTEDEDAFVRFLEAFDSLSYIERAKGMVAPDFDPAPALRSLLEAVRQDPDWEGPYVALVQLGRACARYQVGSFEVVEPVLKELADLVSDDYRAWFALGEVYETVGNLPAAADMYEKAIELEPDEPALYTRLGIVQTNLNMPANAERSFRQALDREGPDKPSADFLAQLLANTGRAHEVPPIYKAMIDADPQNGLAHAKYATALIQAGKEEEGLRAFDLALETVEDNLVVKRHYAPVLVRKGDYDHAMDLYEDCIDANPTDVPVLLEYAQTLHAAGRQFEIPRVLQDVLRANPDPNTRAQTLALLIEIEQPKRVEAVQNASEMLQKGDHEGAVRELKPVKNWLADYWKMWLLYAQALNGAGQYEEAEVAARQLLALFPACEPGFPELRASLAGQGKFDEALNVMRNAVKMFPESFALALNYALAAKDAGHMQEAREMARRLSEVPGAMEQFGSVLGPLLD